MQRAFNKLKEPISAIERSFFNFFKKKLGSSDELDTLKKNLENQESNIKQEFAEFHKTLAQMRRAQDLQQISSIVSRKESITEYERALILAGRKFTEPREFAELLDYLARMQPHIVETSSVFERLGPSDQIEFIQWVMFRFMKINSVPKTEVDAFRQDLKDAKDLPSFGEQLVGEKLIKVNDMRPFGYDLKFICARPAILVNDFQRRQYHHPMVHPKEGDIIIDAGAYTGDSAIVFGHDTNYSCDIHSFEISPKTIEILKANLALTPAMNKITTIAQYALASKSGGELSFDADTIDDSSFQVSKDVQSNNVVKVSAITLDDYVQQASLPRVDFIKMDIEGSERDALKGAQNTIAKYKPRLAISIYHIWDDVHILPRLILEANPNYSFGFKWTNLIAGNEAVLFAYPKK